MASVSLEGMGNIKEISDILISEVPNSGLSCEIIDKTERAFGGGRAVLLVFEKYYMRSSNRASLSIMLTEYDNRVIVDAVSSGGGQGAVFKFSWGAEESFVGIVPRILSSRGFA